MLMSTVEKGWAPKLSSLFHSSGVGGGALKLRKGNLMMQPENSQQVKLLDFVVDATVYECMYKYLLLLPYFFLPFLLILC